MHNYMSNKILAGSLSYSDATVDAQRADFESGLPNSELYIKMVVESRERLWKRPTAHWQKSFCNANEPVVFLKCFAARHCHFHLKIAIRWAAFKLGSGID